MEGLEEQLWCDSGTNTALSCHCHSRSPRAQAAAYSNRHIFGSWWHPHPPFFDFCLQQTFALRCFSSSTLYRGRNCCVTAAASQWRGETSPPPRASVIPFCVSLTLQLGYDAQRHVLVVITLNPKTFHISHSGGMPLNGWQHVLDETTACRLRC